MGSLNIKGEEVEKIETRNILLHKIKKIGNKVFKVEISKLRNKLWIYCID